MMYSGILQLRYEEDADSDVLILVSQFALLFFLGTVAKPGNMKLLFNFMLNGSGCMKQPPTVPLPCYCGVHYFFLTYYHIIMLILLNANRSSFSTSAMFQIPVFHSDWLWCIYCEIPPKMSSDNISCQATPLRLPSGQHGITDTSWICVFDTRTCLPLHERRLFPPLSTHALIGVYTFPLDIYRVILHTWTNHVSMTH